MPIDMSDKRGDSYRWQIKKSPIRESDVTKLTENQINDKTTCDSHMCHVLEGK